MLWLQIRSQKVKRVSVVYAEFYVVDFYALHKYTSKSQIRKIVMVLY